MAGENQRTGRKSAPVSLCPMWNGLGLNPSLHGDKPVTNSLNYETVHYRVHKSSPLDPILSQLNSVHILVTFKIRVILRWHLCRHFQLASFIVFRLCQNFLSLLSAMNASKVNSVALVRERNMPIKRPPLVGEVVLTFADRGCLRVSATDPPGRILGFLDRSRCYFFQVAPQLSSRG
jgi:hypothetical protein